MQKKLPRLALVLLLGQIALWYAPGPLGMGAEARSSERGGFCMGLSLAGLVDACKQDRLIA